MFRFFIHNIIKPVSYAGIGLPRLGLDVWFLASLDIQYAYCVYLLASILLIHVAMDRRAGIIQACDRTKSSLVSGIIQAKLMLFPVTWCELLCVCHNIK